MLCHTMKQKTCRTFFYLTTFIHLITCQNNFVKFKKVSFFKGNILFKTSARSVFTCLAECVQHQAICQGARYNKESHECQLLHADKMSSDSTVDIEAGSDIYVKVFRFAIK